MLGYAELDTNIPVCTGPIAFYFMRPSHLVLTLLFRLVLYSRTSVANVACPRLPSLGVHK